MKIVFDHQIFGWQKYGGISRYALELAGHLSSMPKQDVSLLSPLYINDYIQNAPKSLHVIGAKVPSFASCGRVYRTVNNILAAPLYQAMKPDIVHETYYSNWSVAPKKAKKILTIYDMIHERYLNNFSKFDPLKNEKIAAVKRADHLICISQQTQKDLIELLDVNPAKTSVIHLGFSLINAKKSNLILDNTKPYLLYVGKRDGYKNYTSLLKAYAKSTLLKNEFSLVCFGGGVFSNDELNQILALGVNKENVIQVSGNDSVLADLYSNARLFVYPSLYEGFGIPPLEAMSFNCPVACSNTSSIPEVVANAATYFDPTSVDSICDALEKVVFDSKLTADLISRGQSRIKHFTWEKCAEETLAIYREVLS